MKDEDERIYFTRQKSLDEYVTDAVQDAYERRLNSIIDNRGKEKRKSVKEEIKDLINCEKRSRRRKRYFD